MKTFIITGATQGLGRATAEALAADKNNRVVLAVRNPQRGREVAAEIGENVKAMELDLGSLANVEAFATQWNDSLAGLVNNAGVQITNETRFTSEGYEETIAVNHLAAFLLTQRLLPQLRGGRVLFIGSGTHNPNHKTATRFGFRGARFTSIEELARGEGDAQDTRQLGMDRYATSKYLNMLSGMELARRHDPETTAFFTLDPGLMAGTGLARTAPAVARLLWSSVLCWVSPLMEDTSTPERSGAAAAWIMTDPAVIRQNGEVFSYNRKPAGHVWEQARDPELGKRVVDETLAFLESRKGAN